MTLTVRWGKRAQADLDRIDDYYVQIDQELANAIARKVVAAANFLSEWPRAGGELGDGPRRKWSVRDAPYVIVYRAAAERILILRVRHMREDWRPE